MRYLWKRLQSTIESSGPQGILVLKEKYFGLIRITIGVLSFPRDFVHVIQLSGYRKAQLCLINFSATPNSFIFIGNTPRNPDDLLGV